MVWERRRPGRAHREADIHVHDLDMLSGYCAGWLLRTLLSEGLNGVSEKAEAGPPKHFSVALGQAVNFLGALQSSFREVTILNRRRPTYFQQLIEDIREYGWEEGSPQWEQVKSVVASLAEE